LVLNGIRKKAYEFSENEMSKFTNLKVLGSIPFDKKVFEALTLKKPITEYSPKSKASKEFIKLAYNIAGEKYEKYEFLKKISKRFLKIS